MSTSDGPLPLTRFVGKVAVVTGASSGIGKAIVELLVRQGVIVAGLARRVDRINEHARRLSGPLHAFKCDLTKQEEIIATFKNITEALGPIHVLINNAGLLLATDVIDGDFDKWKTMLDTNVLAVASCTREAIASMKANKVKGHIVNVNSVAGHRVPDYPGTSLYPATKFAVTGLTETVRLEINRAKLPIKITSLSPGYVKTEFLEVAGMPGVGAVDQIPGLAATDVADAVAYVLSTPEHVNVKELTLTLQGST